MSILKSAFSAVSWTVLLDMAGRVIGFIVAIYAARVFDPETFGIYAVTFSVISILNALLLPGLFSAVINHREYQSLEFKQTAWTFELFLMKIVLTVFIFIAAFAAPYVYEQPLLKEYLLFLALVPLVQAFQPYYNYELLIKLDYKGLFKYRIVPVMFKNISMVFLIWYLENIWALLIPELIGAISLVIFGHLLNKSPVRFRFDLKKARQLWSFSKHIVGTQLMRSIKASVDKLVLGKIFTLSDLGYYNIGEKASNQLTSSYTAIFNKALYPVYSKAKNDNKDAIIIPRLTVEAISLVVIPGILVLSCYANEIISLIFGDRWLPSRIIFVLFLLVAIFRLVNSSLGLFFRGKGLPNIEFRMNVLYFFSFLLAILLLSQWGIIWGAVSVLISDIIATAYLLVIGGRMSLSIGKETIKLLHISLFAAVGLFLLYELSSVDRFYVFLIGLFILFSYSVYGWNRLDFFVYGKRLIKSRK